MKGAKEILLALTDMEEAAGFKERLAEKGLDVVTAADGGTAIEAAIKSHPALIITDMDLPVMDGPRVFSILRSNQQTSSIPFVFISDVVMDLKGFRGGTDTFLLRPFNPDEVFGRIRQVLLLKGGARGGRREIQGKLSQMSLPDIIQFLHLNRKEGELSLTSGALSGTVYIKGGEIQNAVLDGVEKEKALFRLLDWGEGDFEFTPMAVQVSKKVRSSTSNLLMEGLRQLDEMRQGPPGLPAPQSLLSAAPGASELKRGLPPVFYEAVQLLKLYPRVADVVEHSTFPDYEVYKALAAMISRGMVVEQAGGKGGAGEFFTLAESLLIRERITSRFTDIVDYARVMVISSSGDLVDAFISGCARIPGFSVDTRTIFSQAPMGGRFGTVARLRLEGGLDVVIFSVPTARNMGPVLRAFSTNLVGLIVLYGPAPEIPGELAVEKDSVLSFADVPVVHVRCAPGVAGGEKETGAKAGGGPKDAAPAVLFDPADEKAGPEVFAALFKDLLAREKA